MMRLEVRARHIREGWGVLFRFIPRASGKQWAEGGGYELSSNNTHLFSLNRIHLTAKCKMHWREHKMNVKARRLASGYRPRREMLKTQTRKPRSSSDGFPEGLPTPIASKNERKVSSLFCLSVLPEISAGHRELKLQAPSWTKTEGKVLVLLSWLTRECGLYSAQLQTPGLFRPLGLCTRFALYLHSISKL